jgi:hypothetical protein
VSGGGLGHFRGVTTPVHFVHFRERGGCKVYKVCPQDSLPTVSPGNGRSPLASAILGAPQAAMRAQAMGQKQVGS